MDLTNGMITIHGQLTHGGKRALERAATPDWGAIGEAKQAEADRYYGRGHSAGHTPPAQGADKRRAKRKASRKARKAAR